MQDLKMYAVRDSKAGTYGPPIFVNNDDVATRALQKSVLDPSSDISKFPEDFDLYFIGTFNDGTGKISPVDTPQHLVKAANVLNRT